MEETYTMRVARIEKRSLLAMVGIAFVLLAVACSGTAPRTAAPSVPSPVAQQEIDPEWSELVAAAQSEGRVVIAAGGEPSREYRPLLEVFSKKYGVTAEMTTGNARDTVNRVLAERASGTFTVDIGLIAHNTGQRRLVPANALTPVEPLLMHPEVVDRSLWYGGQHWYADSDQQFVFLYTARPETSWRFWYNTQRISEQEIASIKSLAGFFDPKWRGKNGSLAPSDPAGLATLIRLYIEPDAGPEWVRKYLFESEVTFTADRRVLETWLTQGRFPLQFPSSSRNDLVELQEAGLPIKELEIPRQQPGLLPASSASSLEVFDNPPHPNAAKLFLNWFLSKEGQTEIQKIEGAMYGSLREDIGYGVIDPTARRSPGVTYSFDEAEPWRADAANAAVAQIQQWWESRQ
jgi:iron(III) transport system substrate-binding protein